MNLSCQRLAGYTSAIASFLTFRDVRSLQRTSRGIRNLVTHQIQEQVLKRTLVPLVQRRLLRMYGHDNNAYETFLAHMREHALVISGSFVLQALLELDWFDSDIDVWKTVDGLAPVRKNQFARKRFAVQAHTIASPEFETSSKHFEYPWSEHHINAINTFERKGDNHHHLVDRMQVIEILLRPQHAHRPPGANMDAPLVHFGTINEYLCATFDLDICKVIFEWDAESGAFRSAFGEHTIDALVHNRCSYTRSVRLDTIVQRYRKYTARGFRIDLPSNLNEFVAYFLQSSSLAFDAHCHRVVELKDGSELEVYRDQLVPCHRDTCFAHLCGASHLHARDSRLQIRSRHINIVLLKGRLA